MHISDCRHEHLSVINSWLESDASVSWRIADIEQAILDRQYIVRVLDAAARDDSSAQSLSGFYLASTAADECSLLYIYVDEAFRQQGIGTLLLRDLVETAQGRGLVSIFLEVRQSNGAAISLYRRSGFLSFGVRKNYYPAQGGTKGAGAAEDALLFSRAVDQ